MLRLRLLVRLRVHERVHAIRLVEVLHVARLEVSCRHLFIRIEGTLYHCTRLNILDLRANERSALARLYMLEINDLPDTAINFNRQARAEISTINHSLTPSKNSIIS